MAVESKSIKRDFVVELNEDNSFPRSFAHSYELRLIILVKRLSPMTLSSVILPQGMFNCEFYAIHMGNK